MDTILMCIKSGQGEQCYSYCPVFKDCWGFVPADCKLKGKCDNKSGGLCIKKENCEYKV